HGGCYAIQMRVNIRPLLVPENHDSDFASSEVLLISNVFVRGKEEVVSCQFRLGDQFTVFKQMPTDLAGVGDVMSYQAVCNSLWDAIVEQDFHSEVNRTMALFRGSRV